MTLTENTIFITGGGTGIGRGLPEALDTLGNQIIISALKPSLRDRANGPVPRIGEKSNASDSSFGIR